MVPKARKFNVDNFWSLSGSIYKKLQSRFLGPNRPFPKKSLENLVFEISCGGKDLAGFQKPLFGTPKIIPYPSPLLFSSTFLSNLRWLQENRGQEYQKLFDFLR
jgi:hypothetical protein